MAPESDTTPEASDGAPESNVAHESEVAQESNAASNSSETDGSKSRRKRWEKRLRLGVASGIAINIGGCVLGITFLTLDILRPEWRVLSACHSFGLWMSLWGLSKRLAAMGYVPNISPGQHITRKGENRGVLPRREAVEALIQAILREREATDMIVVTG